MIYKGSLNSLIFFGFFIFYHANTPVIPTATTTVNEFVYDRASVYVNMFV